ncbi:hypothetical protein CVO_03215 [Sulfurimonas sp. CVO]|jgi:hypothetical protein|uniref:Uncharacterized protein n=1 Tax=Sulfurimonas xiamenensis TaxID=2590021 RepID=A0AAJ4DMV1_9BACT|nr:MULTISPECIES: hypothetical protein [Sulfurimonas]PLY15457.1 MAG: hypothetical protein C0628_02810 [Sulfurimonas sp.]QFR43524.1 hypothetical protein FJR47_06225 [Sulfurimonas xiamenensis]QHG90906.1 hypothetical protein CVO_03215 [Sulfurimonas sp. CVO]
MKTFLLLLFSIYSLNAQIVVVTNKNSQIDTISKEIIQYIYLAKTDTIDGVKVKPILSNNENLHNEFCNTVLCKSEFQYNSYWARLVFTGREPISKRLEWEDIVNKLKEVNTIVYINKKNIRDEWKIIYEEN